MTALVGREGERERERERERDDTLECVRDGGKDGAVRLVRRMGCTHGTYEAG